MKCPNCKIDLIEEEYGSSHTEITCGGYYCEQCELAIPPKDMEDFVLSMIDISKKIRVLNKTTREVYNV